MPTIPIADLKLLRAEIVAMDDEFKAWRPQLQEVARYVMPRRFDWLAAQSPLNTALNPNSNQVGDKDMRNKEILDPTATKAVRVLAAGLLNGITSPARPWFDIDLVGDKYPGDQEPIEISRYKQEVLKILFRVMSQSNFYNSMAVAFLDLAAFGTNATLIYEDFEQVIRCYSAVVGEYRLGQSHRRMVDRFARSLVLSVDQCVQQFGLENCSEDVQNNHKRGGQALYIPVTVCHILRPSQGKQWQGNMPIIEVYFEANCRTGKLLQQNAYAEMPGLFPRWELVGSETYGVSPIMDAMPDVRQLQVEVKEKGAAIAYMIRPPIVADQILKSVKGSLLPGSRVYVPSHSAVGAKPIYTVQPPLQEMRNDIIALQNSIYEFCHNDLFRMISQLDTVRSATEIDARREEKLVQLGAVLERFENEALDPAILRIFNICKRKGLLPEPPPQLANKEFRIRYVSVLAEAQRSVGTASIERFLQFIGSLGPIWPEVLQVPDVSELIRDYADRLNVPASGIKGREEVAAALQAQQDQVALQQEAVTAQNLTAAGKNLSQTDVGGGENVLQRMLAS